jgi:hypothetical protein
MGKMKKAILVTVFVMILLSGAVFAQSQRLNPQAGVPEYRVASGSWSWNAVQGRLYQNDERATIAKVNLRIPQTNAMQYDFNVRYEGALTDTHAGFGIHLFVDDVVNTRSWGSGHSYLLWLNYDENPVSRDIPAGFSAQVYYSRSQYDMQLVESIDLNEYTEYLTPDVLLNPVSIRIVMDPISGEVRVYDPFDSERDYYFYFYVDPTLIKNNSSWVSLRTNSMKASFGMGL